MSSNGSKVSLRNSTSISSSADVSFALRGSAGPIRESMVVNRARHLAAVFTFSLYGPQAGDSTLGARLEFAALFGLNHEDVLL